jgi:elongation factor Ts
MSSVSMDDVKKLRDETGVSIMQCKKALEEAGGDIEKAKVLLRKISATVAAKKSDRELGAGTVGTYLHNNKQVAAVVVLACETDFVSKNADFEQLAYNIAMHVAATAPQFKGREDVSDADIAAARDVFKDEVKDKPADMQEKILAGKLDSYLKDKVLLEQPFIKEPEKTIQTLLDEATQKFGERTAIAEYRRFSV